MLEQLSQLRNTIFPSSAKEPRTEVKSTPELWRVETGALPVQDVIDFESRLIDDVLLSEIVVTWTNPKFGCGRFARTTSELFMRAHLHARIASYTNYRRAPIGLGQPSNPPKPYRHRLHARTTFATTFSPINNELILYSYAQLTGTIQITPFRRSASYCRPVADAQSIVLCLVEGAWTSPWLRRHLRCHLNRGIVQWHSHLSSFSWVFFLLPLWSLQSQAPVRTCGPDLLGGDQEDVDHEEPLPTYEIQAVMLASVDLSCGPGESHSCPFFHYYSRLEISWFIFTISSRQLHHPAFQENPPPTFKGKSLKLLYELVVGTPWAGLSGGRGLAWITSVVYWRCWFGCTTMFLSCFFSVSLWVGTDLKVGSHMICCHLWPIIKRQDVGMPNTEAKVVEV